MRHHRLAFPERVVVGVGDEVVPGGDLLVQVLPVRVGQRPEVEVPVEGVVAIELERLDVLAAFHHRRVLEGVAQAERAVVVEVVTQPHVGRGGLR